MSDSSRSLRSLSRLHGLLPSYLDAFGQRREASEDSLLSVLRSLGVAIEHADQAERFIREAERSALARSIEPVLVRWLGRPLELRIRVPESASHSSFRLSVTSERGERLIRDVSPHEIEPSRGTASAAGAEARAELLIRIRDPLPLGAHDLVIEAGTEILRTCLIVAPRRAHALEGRHWGVFVPLYALHTRESLGVGDVDDLGALVDAVARMGGGTVATLPLCASFLDEPFDPSPYAPVSRRHWNEIYLDVDSIPEGEGLADAALRLGTSHAAKEARAAVASQSVDHRRVMSLKRGFLEACARRLFTHGGPRLEELERFVRARPGVLEYGRFRAAGERFRAPWPRWPMPERDGLLRASGLEDERVRYHVYAQWLLRDQFGELAHRARSVGPGLALDFPIGTHVQGFDTWQQRASFLPDCTLGAPPDRFFSNGQNWGTAAPHPWRIGAGGASHFRECLAAHMAFAGILRIDHVMGLHRVFVIPRGSAARDGVYVSTPHEILYAALALESARHSTAVVGEDLGTVPATVRSTMRKRGLLGTFALQAELLDEASPASPRAPSAHVVAQLNTHDMPTFAGFLAGRDVTERERRGELGRAEAKRQRAARRAARASLAARVRGRATGAPEALLKASLHWLAESEAPLVIVNLEDLWLETEPQNVPGTPAERGNWVRRTRHSLEEVLERASAMAKLAAVARSRTQGGEAK